MSILFPDGTKTAFYRNTLDAYYASLGYSARDRDAIFNQPKEVTLHMYWSILLHAAARDPKLASAVGDPADWKTPDQAHVDCPSGHGNDVGIYVTRGPLTLILMENDARELYLRLPTLENYYIHVERRDDEGQLKAEWAAKYQGGVFQVLMNHGLS